MSIPPAWRDYKPLTTTMSTLEDLERMSSSAVSSGESSHPRICWRLWNSRMARRLGDQSPSTTSSAPPRATNLPPLSLDGTRHTLKELSIEARIRYLHVGYYKCRHTCALLSSSAAVQVAPSLQLCEERLAGKLYHSTMRRQFTAGSLGGRAVDSWENSQSGANCTLLACRSGTHPI